MAYMVQKITLSSIPFSFPWHFMSSWFRSKETETRRVDREKKSVAWKKEEARKKRKDEIGWMREAAKIERWMNEAATPALYPSPSTDSAGLVVLFKRCFLRFNPKRGRKEREEWRRRMNERTNHGMKQTESLFDGFSRIFSPLHLLTSFIPFLPLQSSRFLIANGNLLLMCTSDTVSSSLFVADWSQTTITHKERWVHIKHADRFRREDGNRKKCWWWWWHYIEAFEDRRMREAYSNEQYRHVQHEDEILNKINIVNENFSWRKELVMPQTCTEILEVFLLHRWFWDLSEFNLLHFQEMHFLITLF